MTSNLKFIRWGAVIVVIAAALILPRLLISEKSGNPPQSDAGQPRSLPVQTYIVQPQLLENAIRTTGTLLANEEVELRSEITGKVTEIFFREGGAVAKGDLLVKINDAELQAQRRRLEFEKALAADQEFRQRQQFEKELISRAAYDVSLNELNTVKAQIDLVQAQIDKTEIRAPFDGVIGLKYISAGSYLSPTVKVANLLSIHPIKIQFSIPEKYASEVRGGEKISFTTQGSPQFQEGSIYAIEPKVDPATRTILVRALSPNPQRLLFPGAFADVRLIIERIPEALMIPTRAVIPELNGNKVFLYKNGTAEPAAVETGTRTPADIQITGGISAGDTVITSGILQLRRGMAVAIAE